MAGEYFNLTCNTSTVPPTTYWEVRTLIFSSENYEFWRIKMITIFKLFRLWNLVENGITILDSKKKKKAEEILEDEDDEKMAAIFMKDANVRFL
ncbi:unnamed protein product [Prunus brigantina]